LLGARKRAFDRRSGPLADLVEAPVQPLAELVGIVVALGTVLAGKDNAGGGHAREAGGSHELPGDAHGP
jgi:hypothetical protein